MKVKIKELAEQLDFPIGLTDPQWAFENNLYEFAELIIQECIDAFVDDYGVDIISDVLNKHFGVEE